VPDDDECETDEDELDRDEGEDEDDREDECKGRGRSCADGDDEWDGEEGEDEEDGEDECKGRGRSCGDDDDDDARRYDAYRRDAGPHALSLTQLTIEIERRRYQREVSERLRKVAEQLAGRPDLLREEPNVVAVREHLLEDQPGLAHTAGAG
jgi:hypothetical protein